MNSRRISTRFDCHLQALLERENGSVPCIIQNISTDGISININSFSPFKVDENIIVEQKELGKMSGVIRWVGMGSAGISFDRNLTSSKVLSTVAEFIEIHSKNT